MTTALVTGAGGFIGRNLVEALLKVNDFDRIICLYRNGNQEIPEYNDERIVEVFLDLSQEYEVKTLFKFERIDTIFHLAGNPLVKPDLDNPNKIWLDNVVSTNSLLSYCREGIKFVLASTITVYGDYQYSASEYISSDPISMYAATKLASETMLNVAYNQNRVLPVILRVSANVGKYSTHGVVHDFIRKIRDNPTLEVFGSKPGSKKPYAHVGDVADAFVQAGRFKHEAKNSMGKVPYTFNIAAIDSINIEQLAHAVMSGVGVEKEIVWLGDSSTWVGDNKKLEVDTYCASKFLKWYPKYPTSNSAVVAGVKDILNVNT